MIRYRCFHEGPLDSGKTVELAPREASHLAQVRRARSGDRVAVVNGAGALAEGVLQPGDRRKVLIELDTVHQEMRPPVPLELAPALLKGAAWDEVLSRSVELGATALLPVLADHSVAQVAEGKADAKRERWRDICVDALKQCERLWLPEVHAPVSLLAALDGCSERGTEGVALMEHSEARAPHLLDLLEQNPLAPRCLFVGPEGGWSAGERALLTQRAKAATLGSGVLRAETACFSVLSLCRAVLERTLRR